MTVHHETFTLDTRGDGEVIDVTDLTEKSIANSGVAEGTVKSWLHRGRTALAAQFTAEANHA